MSGFRMTTKAEPMVKSLKYRDDYVGMRFGEMVVIGYPTNADGIRRGGAICRCDCGEEFKVYSMNNVFKGGVTCCPKCSYGKFRQTMRKRAARNVTNPFYEYRNERLYAVWRSMLSRCDDKTKNGYGADGVSVCVEWRDYTVFKKWALDNGYDENAPSGKCTIDRINPFGNYEPSNCRWVDMKTQNLNKRSHWLEKHTGEQEAMQWQPS